MTGRLLLLTTMAAAVLGLGYGAYEHFGERSRGTPPDAPAEAPLVAAPEERVGVPEPAERQTAAPPEAAADAARSAEDQDAARAVLVPPDAPEEAARPEEPAPPAVADGPPAVEERAPAAEAPAPPAVALAPPAADEAPPPAEAPAAPEPAVAPPMADREHAAAPAPASPAPEAEERPATVPPATVEDPPAEVGESVPPVAAQDVPAEAAEVVEGAPVPADDAPSPPPVAELPDPPPAAPPEPEAHPDEGEVAAVPEMEAGPPAADPPADRVTRGVEQIRRALAALLAPEEDPAQEPEAAPGAAPPPPAPAEADPLPEEPAVAVDPAPAPEPEVAGEAAAPAAGPEPPDLVSRSVETIRRALAAIVAGEDPPPDPAAGAAPEAEIEAEVALAPADEEPRVGPDEVLPSFDIVRVGPDGRGVLAGRAAPGAEVEVRAGEQVIDAITADRRGQWVAAPPEPLAPGHLELTLLAREPGGTPLLSSEVVVVVVPGPPPPQPPAVAASEPPPPQPPEVAVAEAEAPPEAAVGPPGEVTAALAPADPLALLLPREGGRGRVLQAPGKISSGGELALMVLDYDESGQVRLTGEAPPGAPVRIYVDNQLAGEAVAGEAGDWSLVLARQLDPGDYTLRLDQLDPGGRPVARLETPFSRVGQPPVAGEAQVDYVIVQPGNSLWRISRRLFGQGMLYTEIYDANQGQIRDPDLIYPGQVFEIPAGLGEAG